MFYVLVFGLLAVLLVAAGVTALSRRRRQLDMEDRRSAGTTSSARHKRKAERAQSQKDRRKRH